MLLFYLQMIETEEDKSKFEAIHEAYKSLMFKAALNKGIPHQDCEDMVHQAFVKIAEHIKRIEPVSPRTQEYVVIIVENTCNDYWRKLKRQPEFLSYDDEQYVPTTPGSELELELDSPLAKCIHQLPELYRHVIILKYYHGYTLKEIADMLSIKLSWAQKIDQRAKKKLAELYQKELEMR